MNQPLSITGFSVFISYLDKSIMSEAKHGPETYNIVVQ
jgi:hypothetical protein